MKRSEILGLEHLEMEDKVRLFILISISTICFHQAAASAFIDPIINLMWLGLGISTSGGIVLTVLNLGGDMDGKD